MKLSTALYLGLALALLKPWQVMACTEMPKGPGGLTAKVNSVLFQRGETKEFCLPLPKANPKPLQNVFVEWQTVNKNNTSCGVLRNCWE